MNRSRVFRSTIAGSACAALLWGGGSYPAGADSAPELSPLPAPKAVKAPPADITVTWGDDPKARAFESGYCVGYFHPVAIVNWKIEWGADTHCSGTGWIPHQLNLVLEKQKDTPLFPDIFFEWAGEVGSPASSFGSPDISLHEHWRVCDSEKKRKYRIVATLTAGSHSTQSMSDEYEVNCDLNLELKKEN